MMMLLPTPLTLFQTRKLPMCMAMTMTLHYAMIQLMNKPLMTSHHFTDTTSLTLTTLTIFTLMIITLSSTTLPQIATMSILITFTLIMTFTRQSLITFYIFFELSIIPTFLLIMKEGKQPERMQASIYLLMYTIFASLPLLLGILMTMPTNSIPLMYQTNHQIPLPLLFTLAFLAKLPMFTLHLWLPKAHVEAPMEGSMILAAILLKLGGYGLIRIIPMMEKTTKAMSPWMMSISLAGALSTALTCNRHKDMKAIIAYSSIAHMALVIMSLFSMSHMALAASICTMISHGLCSSALFMLVTITYNNHHSRNLFIFKGLSLSSPNYSLWWFIFLMANVGTPPFLNLVSEILSITTMAHWSLTTLPMIFMTAMLIAAFSVMMFSMINHNTPSHQLPILPLNTTMSLSYTSHATPLILMLLNPSMLTQLP